MKIPDLQLSLGQLAWTLNLGQTPPQHLFDRLRYLRQIGIPFDPNDQLTGKYKEQYPNGMIATWVVDKNGNGGWAANSLKGFTPQ